jgi:hypothetical protein
MNNAAQPVGTTFGGKNLTLSLAFSDTVCHGASPTAPPWATNQNMTAMTPPVPLPSPPRRLPGRPRGPPPAVHRGHVAPAEAASHTDLMQAVAQVAREQLSRRWVASDTADRAAKARRVYYLSMEFLIGRTWATRWPRWT